MSRFWKLLSLNAVLLVGCYTTYDPYYYDTAYYDPYYSYYDAAYAYTWVDPYGTYYVYSGAVGSRSQQPELNLPDIAAGIANAAPAYYTPPGCANVSATDVRVNYAFANCTNPLGLSSINGNVTVALSQNASRQLVLTATSENLEVNGEPFIVDSITTVTSVVGDQRMATISSRSRAPGRVDARQADFTVAWQRNSGCVEVNGTSTSTARGITATTTLTGFQRCAGQCPTAGTVTVTSPEGEFTGTFDGSPTLRVTAPNGDTRDIQVQCQ